MIADPRDAPAVSPSCSSRAAATPMEGLGVAGPAPFLRKTYDMASDPGTDAVVSWASSQESFVVWDPHEFSKQVLPQYFKHSNFSSFIRQLNTYGFRKIHSDRWEFANKGFQGGKKHLLNNIKRRRKFSNHTKPWSSTVTLDYPKGGKEAELETLKKDQEEVKAEIMKLREERENLQREINRVAKRIRYAECRHRQMLLFVSKAAKSPNFVQHLIQERRQKRELETCELSKKSQLLGPNSESTKCLLEVMDHKIRSLNVDCLRISDDSAQMESGPNNVVPEDFEWFPPMGGGDFRDQMARTSQPDSPSVFHEMPEKLPGDNVVAGDGAEDVEVEELLLAADDTGIYLELNEKPWGWAENTSELGEQAAGLTP